MAPDPSPLTPVTALTARKTWRTVEPLHAMIYFAPEASESYARLGIRQEAGYFASRSAPMGAVSAETVIATFFNFSPALVRAVIPGVWNTATPGSVLEARIEAADATLARILGEGIRSPEMGRAAELARRAAERACERYEGRPLFAGHAGLAWPDAPHLVLWHAQTLLREFRGDGHVAQLVTHDIDPVEALVMHVASGDVPVSFLRDTRGWSDSEWGGGVKRLDERGWVHAVEVGSSHAASGLTEQGTAVRQEIEDATDRMAIHPYEAIGEDGCAELRALARPFSRAVVDTEGFGF
jgi:hypothetical protein